MASPSNWTFNAFPPFPPTVLPNVALWNATNPTTNQTFQITASWPFEWSSRNVTKPALAMYVLDGNAMGLTAAEALKRRAPISFGQPDTVLISIGYPLTNAVYDMVNRFSDYKPVFPNAPPTSFPPRADAFLDFISLGVQPWLSTAVFPNVHFTRSALFGHSFGGLLVVYALLSRPDMFDTYLPSSPALETANGTILDDLTARFGTGDMDASAYYRSFEEKDVGKPAVMITYGSLEEFPARRRTENETAFQARREYFRVFKMTQNCRELFDRIKASGRVRDVVVKEYVGQDHAGVAASGITDGIDYFVDW